MVDKSMTFDTVTSCEHIHTVHFCLRSVCWLMHKDMDHVFTNMPTTWCHGGRYYKQYVTSNLPFLEPGINDK
jgi:hypothetical protein